MWKLAIFLMFLLAPMTVIAQQQSQVEEAKKLLMLMNADAIFEQTYKEVDAQISRLADQYGISDEQRPAFDRYMDEMKAVMKEELSWEKLEPEMVNVYVQVYSEEELRELNEFYSSPLGRKFIEKMPVLMKATMQMTQSMIQRMIPRLDEIQERMAAEFGKGDAGDR
jgi:hypothetical protein